MIPRAAALAAVATLPDGLSKHRRRLAKLINEIPEEEKMTQSTKEHPAILEERAAQEATIARLTAENKRLTNDLCSDRFLIIKQGKNLGAAIARAEAAEAERDALIGAAYEAAARRIVSHDKGTPMHSPPQLLTDAHDQIMSLTPADATAALAAAKAEAARKGYEAGRDDAALVKVFRFEEGGHRAKVPLQPATQVAIRALTPPADLAARLKG